MQLLDKRKSTTRKFIINVLGARPSSILTKSTLSSKVRGFLENLNHCIS